MPSIQLSNDLNMHYEIDDFTDPWKSAETILMLHGNCESGKVWFGWVPHLARDFKVVRPDMRGFLTSWTTRWSGRRTAFWRRRT